MCYHKMTYLLILHWSGSNVTIEPPLFRFNVQCLLEKHIICHLKVVTVLLGNHKIILKKVNFYFIQLGKKPQIGQLHFCTI